MTSHENWQLLLRYYLKVAAFSKSSHLFSHFCSLPPKLSLPATTSTTSLPAFLYPDASFSNSLKAENGQLGRLAGTEYHSQDSGPTVV